IVYDAFGNVIFQTHPEVKTRYLFTGREFDEETGMYYYRTRYYDPHIGRFLSEDAIRFRARDANLYRYVKNNPIAFVDPNGRDIGVPINVYPTHNVATDVILSFFVPVCFDPRRDDELAELRILNGGPKPGESPADYAAETGGTVRLSSVPPEVCYGSIELVFLIGMAFLAGARIAEERRKRHQAKQGRSAEEK